MVLKALTGLYQSCLSVYPSICLSLLYLSTLGTIQQYKTHTVRHSEKGILSHFERWLLRLLAFSLFFITVSAKSELCKSVVKLTAFLLDVKMLWT